MLEALLPAVAWYSTSVTHGGQRFVYEHGRPSHAYTLCNVIVVAMVMYRGYLALENLMKAIERCMQIFTVTLTKKHGKIK